MNLDEGKNVYVSDVLDIDSEIREHGNKLFLLAGVGAGKSTWVKEVLVKKGSVLFITSRRAKVDEDLKDSCFENIISDTGSDYTLVTNAKLAAALEGMNWDKNRMQIDEFLAKYDYIVVDEVHSIAADSAFADSAFSLLSFIAYVEEKGKKVVAMTGTPEPVEKYFTQKKGWHTIDLRSKCRCVYPSRINWIYKKDRKKYMADILNKDENAKIIYFVNQTDTIKKMYKMFAKEQIVPLEQVAAIVSKNKESKLKVDLEEELGKTERLSEIIKFSEITYQSIIESRMLPDNCRVLLSTSKLKEGIDIGNENITIFCDNHVLSNIIQFCGRVRIGGGLVYIIEDSEPHRVEHDELLYNYADKYEVDAANKYLERYIEGNEMLACNEKEKLINHVRKNPYIYFDFIRNNFRVFHMKYYEEDRVKKNLNDWQQVLVDFCDDKEIYHTVLLSDEKKRKAALELLERAYKMRKRFYVKTKDEKESKDVFVDILFSWLKVKKKDGKYPKQISKVNSVLLKAGMSYQFISKKDNTAEHRDKVYWQVVEVDLGI